MGIFGRKNLVVRRLNDGHFEVVLDPEVRMAIDGLLDQVDSLLDTPDSPLMSRLQPPAYNEDPERDLAYQLLAGEELRTARREAFATVKRIHAQDRATEDDLWVWVRALNALRLVLGTALGIQDDDDEAPDLDALDDDDPALGMWQIYGIAGLVQYEIIEALGGA